MVTGQAWSSGLQKACNPTKANSIRYIFGAAHIMLRATSEQIDLFVQTKTLV